jgi:hypothetical protein
MSCLKCITCSDSINLNFDDLLLHQDLNGDEKITLLKASRNFSNANNRILYFICLLLIGDIIGVLFAETNCQSDNYIYRMGFAQAAILLTFAIFIAVIRVYIFKFYQLHTILDIWTKLKVSSLDRWMFAFACINLIISIGVTTAVFVLDYASQYNTAIGLLLLDIFLYIFTSLFYRLHVGVYIKTASETPILRYIIPNPPGENPAANNV